MLASGRMQRLNPICAASRTRSAGLRDAADFARQAHFAEHRGRRRDDAIADARGDRGQHAEVRGRLVHGHPAGDIDEHIVANQVETRAFLEHREQQRQPLLIDAARHAARVCRTCCELTSACTSTRIGREPSTQHSTAEPGALIGRSARNSLRWIRHRVEARADVISNTPSSLDRAESVLHRTDHAMRVMTLPFEVQHGVNDVLERLGTGEAAILRDVADEERRHVLPFGREQQLRRRLAHLADAAGRGLKFQRRRSV